MIMDRRKGQLPARWETVVQVRRAGGLCNQQADDFTHFPILYSTAADWYHVWPYHTANDLSLGCRVPSWQVQLICLCNRYFTVLLAASFSIVNTQFLTHSSSRLLSTRTSDAFTGVPRKRWLELGNRFVELQAWVVVQQTHQRVEISLLQLNVFWRNVKNRRQVVVGSIAALLMSNILALDLQPFPPLTSQLLQLQLLAFSKSNRKIR